ncbi:hypothetical protein [Tritonibacter mobilis]|uniref:hypothetical protein n=1 Tax=Tritonibacter mobilis TaxID=379347 RepID=UPI000F7F0423|nr:hypothetical protein [Tritonibacter mobilis]
MQTALIKSYIRSNFTQISEQPSGDDSYRDDIEKVTSEFLKFIERKLNTKVMESVHIEHIYAFEKTSCFLSFGVGRLILNNRFFTQTLNNLNKIFLSEDEYSFSPMLVYVLRLMEEQAYVEGLGEFAYVLNYYRRKIREEIDVETVWRFPENDRHKNLYDDTRGFHRRARTNASSCGRRNNFIQSSLWFELDNGSNL